MGARNTLLNEKFHRRFSTILTFSSFTYSCISSFSALKNHLLQIVCCWFDSHFDSVLKGYGLAMSHDPG